MRLRARRHRGADLPGRVEGRDGSVRCTQRGGGRAPGSAVRPDSDAKAGAAFGIGFKLMRERIGAIVGGSPHAARRAIRYGDRWVPMPAGRDTATSTSTCRSSSKWLPRLDARPMRYQSLCSAVRRISIS